MYYEPWWYVPDMWPVPSKWQLLDGASQGIMKNSF